MAEIAAVNAGDRLPLALVADEDAGADDIVEAAAERLDARLDLVEDVDGLAAGIAGADDAAAAMGRRRAAHQDAVADADGAAVAADRFPDAAGVDAQPRGTFRHRL